MEPKPEVDAIEYLVFEKFELLRWRHPRIERLRDAASLTERKAQADAWSEYVDGANEYRLELEQKSESELDALVSEARLKRRANLRKRQVERERAHWSNQPNAIANEHTYDYWCKAAYWTNIEALALLLGRNPNVFNLNAIETLPGRSEVIWAFWGLRNLIDRATEFGFLSEKNTPKEIIEWAQNNNIFVPEKLLDTISDRFISISDLEAKYSSQTLELESLKDELESLRMQDEPENRLANENRPTSTRERESLLKIVIAVAIKKYNYRPDMAKNSATSNIATALRDLDLPLDEDTIRKYLNEAKNLLSEK